MALSKASEHQLQPIGAPEWPEHQISELGRVEAGRQRAPDAPGTPRPYLRVANIFDGHIDTAEVFDMPFTDKEFSRFKLQDGDILLNEGQSLELVGRCSVYRGDPPNVAFQNSLIRFRAGERITTEFAFQLFRHLQYSGVFSAVATQTTSIAHLGVSRFAAIRVRIPPLPEQRKIAAILSSVDDTIEKTQAVIDQLEVVKKGLLGELLTRGLGNTKSQYHHELGASVPVHWQVLPLDAVLAGIDAGWSPQCESRPAIDGEWGILKVSAVSSGTYIEAEHKALPGSMASRPEIEVRQGDVLLTRANGVLDLVGRSAFVHGTRARLLLSDKTLRLRPLPEQLLPYFLHLLLGFEPIRAQLLEETTGSHMRNISQSALRKVIAPIPPLAEQEAIAEAVMALEKRSTVERELIAAQRELKTDLLDTLLSGRIRSPAPAQEAT